MSAPAFRLVDSTLRDGSHAVRHSFTPDQVRSIASRLDEAGVPVIEVAHGDGLGGSSMNYGFSTVRDVDLVSVAREAAPAADIAVLLIPGIGTVDHLREAEARGASVVRVATHCTEADIAEQHLRVARQLGMTALGFLMMSHAIEPGALADQARVMQDAGAEAVYVVDSAGALLPDDVVARVVALRESLDAGAGVGVHTHNNLSMALANTLAAIAEGVEWVDASTRGLGAGAGNCATEALATVCDRAGIPTGLDAFALADLAEDVVAPLMHRPLLVDRGALTLGYAGVYSSFLLHAERAAARFGVDARQILVELGRRGVVGGQEDMIIDVAAELAA